MCDRGQRVGDRNQRERRGTEEKRTSNCVQTWPRLVEVSFVILVGDMMGSVVASMCQGTWEVERDRRTNKAPLNKKQAAVYEKISRPV